MNLPDTIGMHSTPNLPLQVIISGFHRSGTSLTAQYLYRAGLNLGDDLMGANPSNPDGHFEERNIVALHKQMMAANQRDWYTPGSGLSSCVSSFSDQAKALLRRFPADRNMGFKDPRSCLFLPWWHALLDRPAAVIVFRHHAACYHSLRHRQAQNLCFDPSRHKDAMFFWQRPELALQLWLDYNNAIIAHARSEPDSTLLVSHRSLLNGFNLPAAVNQRFGTDLDADCESGIRHVAKDIPGIQEFIDPQLQHRLDETLAALNDLCCSEPEPAATQVHKPVNQAPELERPHTRAENRSELRPTHQPERSLIHPYLDRLHIAADSPGSTDIRSETAAETKNVAELAATVQVGQAEQSDDVKQLIQWGKSHESAKNHEAARACWLKAQALAPRNHAVLLQLALQARNQGRHSEVEALMQSAIRLKPDHAGYHVHLARALQQSDRRTEALGIVHQGLVLQPDHPDLHLLLIELLQANNSPGAARDACRSALLLFPDNRKLVRSMVQLIGQQENSSEAMRWFRYSVLLHMRQQNGYRQSLFQTMEQVPSTQLESLSRQIISELVQLESCTSVVSSLRPATCRSQDCSHTATGTDENNSCTDSASGRHSECTGIKSADSETRPANTSPVPDEHAIRASMGS